ncbi:GFA family protein [Dongia sp.]|uniref:GFA family protein n=1 Tax=Dongia sp. TaxID=1977262 RepID=UPI003753913B
MVMITGGCLCGAVRFTVSEGPITGRVCWCKVCQKLGAGGPAVGAAFKSSAVTVAGALSDYESSADSGNKMHRKFCPVCGTPLFSQAESRPNLVFIRAGALDDPEIAKPSSTIWVSSAPSWASIDPNLPQIAGQPAPIKAD